MSESHQRSGHRRQNLNHFADFAFTRRKTGPNATGPPALADRTADTDEGAEALLMVVDSETAPEPHAESYLLVDEAHEAAMFTARMPLNFAFAA